MSQLTKMRKKEDYKKWLRLNRAALTRAEHALDMMEAGKSPATGTIMSYMPTSTSTSSASAGTSTSTPGQGQGGPSDSARARRKARRDLQAPWSQSPGDGRGLLRSGSRASRAVLISDSP